MLDFLFAVLFSFPASSNINNVSIQRPLVAKVEKSNNPDGDFFIGKNDLCPNIPGKNYGCPLIDVNKSVSKKWTLSVVSENFETQEQKEVAIGDQLFIGFENKEANTIVTVGNLIKITE